MENLKIKSDPRVAAVFEQYPAGVREKMLNLRRLLLETANEIEEVTQLEETLKWGEPSYLTKTGSTIRMDWKAREPNAYALYFQCNSSLIATFRLVFSELFEFEGKRAIIFQLNEPLPETAVKSCLAAGLLYHKLKHLPLLGL